jgi:chromosome partitioning protein
MLIAVASRKGGVGKTTIATNLAAGRAASGYDTKLIDTDPERYAFMWVGTRADKGVEPEIRATSMQGEIKGALIADRIQADTVIVDCAGGNSVELVHVVDVCDVLIIPVKIGQFDVWSLMAIAKLIATARLERQFKVIPVMNALDPQQPDSPLARALEQQVKACFDDPIVKIYERVSVAYAAIEGKGVLELKANRDNAKAIDEFSTLYQEVFNEPTRCVIRPSAAAVASA